VFEDQKRKKVCEDETSSYPFAAVTLFGVWGREGDVIKGAKFSRIGSGFAEPQAGRIFFLQRSGSQNFDR